MSSIRYIQHSAIDKAAWDQLVDQAHFGLPYAYSWVLDLLAGSWDALVLGDYEAILPLPYNRKLLGFAQVFQPYFVQQLGIYSKLPLSPEEERSFLEAIPRKFRKVWMHFNESNRGIAGETRDNLVLDLRRPYEEIHQGYSRTLRRALKKYKPTHVLVDQPLSPSELSDFYFLHLAGQVSVPTFWQQRWIKVMEAAIERDKGFILGAQGADGTLGAVGFFWHSHQRIIHLFCASSPAGKQEQSMRVLMDGIIEQHADQDWSFDFEGSIIPSIAEFFHYFGPDRHPYTVYQRSRPPYSWLDRVRKG